MPVRFLAFSLLLGLAGVGGPRAWAVDISLMGSGDWSETIDWTDLVVGAGSDLRDTHESAWDAGTIEVSNTGGENWEIRVRRSDAGWPSGVRLWVKRTSEGTCRPSGGTSYIEVTSAPVTFFRGGQDCSDIHFQLRVTGISVAVPPASYLTSVVYSVGIIP